ncbi:hypothetical protein FRC16_006554 [Serendipita sp. 398]|nr:hypothetical protein FRC16_006554 [Serendipita sp. 398]
MLLIQEEAGISSFLKRLKTLISCLEICQMSSATGSASRNPNDVVKPADNLLFKESTLIDTIYSSRVKKRPCWLTSTSATKTTLFAIAGSGRLKEKAVIDWASSPSESTTKSEVMVEVEGERYPAERFCKKRTGLVGQASAYVFMAGSLRCQWIPQWGTVNNRMGPFETEYHINWRCFAEEVDTPSKRRSSSGLRTLFKSSLAQTQSKVLLATYQETSNVSCQDGGLVLYPEGVPLTFFLLLSLILFGDKKDAWKTIQSKTRPEEIEAMLTQDAHGDLPAYNPDSSRTLDVHPTVHATSPWRWHSRDGRSQERNRRPFTAQ